jgi:hypothetical protein
MHPRKSVKAPISAVARTFVECLMALVVSDHASRSLRNRILEIAKSLGNLNLNTVPRAGELDFGPRPKW